jgi:lysozyme family protein
MTAANYNGCISKTLEHEGGYTRDPNDRGNFTGCKVGVGENKGTNRGISACSYPNEDIKNMSVARAKQIYHDDFWNPIFGDQLPAGPDLCTFDSAVNSGRSRGVKWLQRAVGAEADGVVGPQTIALVNKADDHVTIDRMCDNRMEFLKGLPTWPNYGKGWTNRVEDVRRTAHGMVADEPHPEPEEPPPAPEPEPLVVRILIDAPPGVVVKVEQIEGEA